MQEHGVHQDGRFTLRGELPRTGANIRRKGESIHQGREVLPKGHRIGPVAVGLLASVGIESVRVHAIPRVAVIRTGGEFMEAGIVEPGGIFSSNDVMLLAALRGEGIHIDRSFFAQDDADDIRRALQAALQDHDMIITTGGVSVGDHDLVPQELRNLGAKIIFHGVAQKPGKPMLFATVADKRVFGLPGNPRAVMILFWEYVLPFLRGMQGASGTVLGSDVLPLTHAVNVKGERAEFRAARLRGGKVTLLADEGSHMLRSLVDADALAYLPAGTRILAEGDHVVVHYLRQ
jgi:molybdopterin molybdotransferase